MSPAAVSVAILLFIILLNADPYKIGFAQDIDKSSPSMNFSSTEEIVNTTRGFNNNFTDELGLITVDQQIDEIASQLSQTFAAYASATLKEVLTELAQQINNMGKSDWQIVELIANGIIQDGAEGPLSQSLVFFTKQRLGDNIQESNQTIAQLTNQIVNVQENGTTDQVIMRILQVATRAMTAGSNDTNQNIDIIASRVAKDTNQTASLQNVLYQIALQIANKGGNMTKAIESIESTIASEMTMAVSFDQLPLTQSLIHLAQQEESENIILLNRVIDRITEEASRNNEDIIDNILIQETQNIS